MSLVLLSYPLYAVKIAKLQHQRMLRKLKFRFNQIRKPITSSIERAVQANDLPKALSLLDEAKALGIEGAQEVFVKAVNARK